MKFLVVEDNIELNKSLCSMLSGMAEVESALDGEQGLYKAETGQYDLIILDLLLPKMNGIEVLKVLRKKNATPVIVLTALDNVDTKITGLSSGADDYVCKPFNRDELLARVESVLRRYNGNVGGMKYQLGNFEISFAAKTVKVDGNMIKIGGKLYEMLEYLVRNKGIIIPKEQLFDRVWGVASDTIYTVTEVYVSNLRKLLEANGIKNRIKTIKTIGYMWSEEN